MPYKFKKEFEEEIREYALDEEPTEAYVSLGDPVREYIRDVGETVDPGIRGFIEGLLSLGYPTESSCAGGPQHMNKEGGFVILNLGSLGELSLEEVREIKALSRHHGLRKVKVYGSGRIYFAPVGGPSSAFPGLI